MIEVDRSRIVAYQRCPRERYLAYHAQGKGLQRRAKSLPLQFGSAFHEGCEDLLTGKGIETAVLRAKLFLSAQFAGAQVEIEESAQAEYSKEEQGALAEALLRGWYSYEGQQFLESFEVVEVEEEGRAQLADDLTLMYRPDAVVRERESGDAYILSWKTCSMFSKRTVNQARTDMQSMSEVYGVTQSRGMKIEGVLYRWAVKGKRDKDEWDGLYKQNSHLIYAWRRVGPGEGDDDWAWAYKWNTEEINEKTGKPKGTTLGKGWKKVPVWREYPGGVKAWIDDLSANRIAPRHISALEAVFPQSLPVDRNARDVANWKMQTVAQETHVAKAVELMSNWNQEYSDPSEALNVLFPQYSHSCEAYSGCSFRDICWNGVPAEEGELYQIRVANHPEEGEGDD